MFSDLFFFFFFQVSAVYIHLLVDEHSEELYCNKKKV